MKLDKKQIPQLTILGLLVIGCMGYVSFTLAKPAETAKPAVESKAAAVAEVTAEPRLAQLGIFPALAAPVARRDPFVVQSLGAAEVTNAPNTQQTVPMAALPKLGFGKIPPLLPFGNSGVGPGAVPRLTIVPTVEPDPAFALTGVIRGDHNVAIIRVGASERHIVAEGQTIDGRYRVLSVTEDGAVLANKDRRIHLRLGGVRNAN